MIGQAHGPSHSETQMKLQARLAKATGKYLHSTDKDGYPFPYGRWTEISRDAKGPVIEFEADRLDVLVEVADQAITPKNVKAVWAAIRHEFVDKVGYRMYGAILANVLEALGAGYNFYTVYELLKDQKGLGFMGGTGVGNKIHNITYTKVVGVKSGLDPLVTEVAQAWFNLMLGELKYTRKETKHLRDAVAEDELVLAINAKPECQATVRYVGAKGYPVRQQSKARVTCAKCSEAW